MFVGLGGFAIGMVANGGAALQQKTRAEAHESYLRGRSLWQTRDAKDLHEATLLLERSVELDPDSAPAHAALADAYAFDFQNWKKAGDQAARAIELDPALGQPHASLGFIRMFWDWNLAAAEPEFKKAVALSPDYATAHQWYAANLVANGHGDAALVEIKKAAEIEPDSAAIGSDQCQILYFTGHFEDALAQCRRVLTIAPRSRSAREQLYAIYLASGRFEEAVADFVAIESDSELGGRPAALEGLKPAFANGGIDAFRSAQIDYFSRVRPMPYRLAQVYAQNGSTDKALQTLAAAAESRDFDFIYIIPDPAFLTLRTDSRIKPLQAKVLGTSVN